MNMNTMQSPNFNFQIDDMLPKNEIFNSIMQF
jgi:hypothetical protein